MSLWINPRINPRNVYLQHETFLSGFTLLYISRIEPENDVDDDFTEDVRTSLKSDFLSTLDKYFSGVSMILIRNEFCRWVSWGEELSFFCLSCYLS